MSILTWKTEREKKQKRSILLEEKPENFIGMVRKWEMLASSKVKVRRSVKKSEQETYNIPFIKVVLQDTIRNDDFYRNTALQHWSDIVSNGYNIVPALPRCFALKIVVANRSV